MNKNGRYLTPNTTLQTLHQKWSEAKLRIIQTYGSKRIPESSTLVWNLEILLNLLFLKFLARWKISTWRIANGALHHYTGYSVLTFSTRLSRLFEELRFWVNYLFYLYFDINTVKMLLRQFFTLHNTIKL